MIPPFAYRLVERLGLCKNLWFRGLVKPMLQYEPYLYPKSCSSLIDSRKPFTGSLMRDFLNSILKKCYFLALFGRLCVLCLLQGRKITPKPSAFNVLRARSPPLNLKLTFIPTPETVN